MPLLSNSVLKNIRLIAINTVHSQSIDWYIEQAYRYYSHHYHTPLHVAKEVVNPAEVVRIFMEDEMLNMTPEDVIAMKEKLQNLPKPMLTAEEYAAEEDSEELSDDEWVLQEMARAEKINKEGGVKKKPQGAPSMAEAMQQAQKAVQDLYKSLEKFKNADPQQNEGDIKFDPEKE